MDRGLPLSYVMAYSVPPLLDTLVIPDAEAGGSSVQTQTQRDPAPLVRDPAPMLAKIKRDIANRSEVWVFGYASLIWRPEFEAAEQQPAAVHGYHRSLRMLSKMNRGTPECPGLVFGLVRGGSCRGMAYRVPRERADEELDRLWLREMPTGVYDPKWLPCRTPCGSTVLALAFTLSRQSPAYTGCMDDDCVLQILRTACGRYGTTLDYLRETARSLKACGIADREVERLCMLAALAGL